MKLCSIDEGCYWILGLLAIFTLLLLLVYFAINHSFLSHSVPRWVELGAHVMGIGLLVTMCLGVFSYLLRLSLRAEERRDQASRQRVEENHHRGAERDRRTRARREKYNADRIERIQILEQVDRVREQEPTTITPSVSQIDAVLELLTDAERDAAQRVRYVREHSAELARLKRERRSATASRDLSRVASLQEQEETIESQLQSSLTLWSAQMTSDPQYYSPTVDGRREDDTEVAIEQSRLRPPGMPPPAYTL